MNPHTQIEAAPAKTYRTSKGQDVLIANMPYPYMKSAHAKLIREGFGRDAEIHAMGAELERREAARAAEQAALAVAEAEDMPF